MKNNLRYLPQLIVGIVILALIAGIYFPLGYIGVHNHEPRNRFVIALDQGALFWGTLTLIFTLAVFALVKSGKYLKGVIAVFLWAFSGMIFYMSLSDLRPFHTDIAIYENQRQEHLIIQYFETGVTGNPRSRLIKTSNIDSPIREYEEIYNAPVLDSLRLYNRDYEERIPKVFTTQTDTFYLKQINNPWKTN